MPGTTARGKVAKAPSGSWAVPAIWPATQFCYVALALPAVIGRPRVAAALALPMILAAPLVVMILAALPGAGPAGDTAARIPPLRARPRISIAAVTPVIASEPRAPPSRRRNRGAGHPSRRHRGNEIRADGDGEDDPCRGDAPIDHEDGEEGDGRGRVALVHRRKEAEGDQRRRGQPQPEASARRVAPDRQEDPQQADPRGEIPDLARRQGPEDRARSRRAGCRRRSMTGGSTKGSRLAETGRRTWCPAGR